MKNMFLRLSNMRRRRSVDVARLLVFKKKSFSVFFLKWRRFSHIHGKITVIMHKVLKWKIYNGFKKSIYAMSIYLLE